MTRFDSSRFLLLRVTLCAAFLSGIALSVPLWVSPRTFPVASVLMHIPESLGSALFIVLLLSLALFSVTGKKWSAALTIIVTAVLIFGDITRFQPWVYLYLLLLGCFAFGDCPRGGLSPGGGADLSCFRLILACTYLWSGVSKLNGAYITETFPSLLESFHAPLFLLTIGALSTALLEAVCGIGLLSPRTRQCAATLLVLMHLSILILLYKIGWNTVVWPWNAAMMILLLLLFWHPSSLLPTVYCLLPGWYPKFILIALGILPSLNLLGLWDSYPSMNLYSGNIDRASILAKSGEVDVILWAVSTLNVPPYPEERVYRQIARSLCPGIVLTVTTQSTLLRPRQTHTYDCSTL